MPGWGCPPPTGGSRELLLRGTASRSPSRFFVLSSPLVRGVQALWGVVGALEYTSPALGRRAAYVGSRRGRSDVSPSSGRGLRPAVLVGTVAKVCVCVCVCLCVCVCVLGWQAFTLPPPMVSKDIASKR
jgi:hypothetical protein